MSASGWAAWVAVAVAVIAILVAIAIARWQRARKELSFEAYTEFPLFAQGPLAHQIEIKANGQLLELPHLLLVTIKNSGNTALRPEDFYEAIHIDFRDALVAALHIEPTTGLVISEPVISPQKITIDPPLLNVGEGMVCYALVEGCPHGVAVRTRIADAKVRDISTGSISESLLSRIRIGVNLGLFGMTFAVDPGPNPRRVRASGTVAPRRDA